MTRLFRATALLTLSCGVATPALAQGTMFDGDWTDGNPAACVIGSDSENVGTRIRDGVLYGIESACRMTNPVTVRDMAAVLYDMDCAGEGESWSYRLLLMRNDDGTLTLLGNGWTRVMQGCAAPSAAPTLPPPPTMGKRLSSRQESR